MTPNLRAELLDTALAAADRGWHVFPLRSRHSSTPKQPAVDRWEQRATISSDQIRDWWSISPLNLGIACGPSHLVLLDLDVPKGPDDLAPEGMDMGGVRDGVDVLAQLAQRAGEPMPWDTYRVQTPTGGIHLYFHAPAGLELRNTEGTKNGLGWKIDTRAAGGYVVGAGSRTRLGRYQLVDDRVPAPLPAWLRTALTPTRPAASAAVRPRAVQVGGDRRARYLQAAIDGERARIGQARQGERNKALFIAAVNLGRLVAGHELTAEEARQALTEASSPHVHASAYTERQQQATIASGFTRGAARPRRIAR